MKPIPFHSLTDTAPIPFHQNHLILARQMKQRGLPWTPHVGCFVWDTDGFIEAESPFPLRVYFILSLPRFLGIFGDLEAVAKKLVWLPTWHQARLLAARFGVESKKIADLWTLDVQTLPGEELLGIYRLILERI